MHVVLNKENPGYVHVNDIPDAPQPNYVEKELFEYERKLVSYLKENGVVFPKYDYFIWTGDHMCRKTYVILPSGESVELWYG